MKPESIRIIETVLANDTTVSQEERNYILDACCGDYSRKGEKADGLQMLTTVEVAGILKTSTKTVKRLIAQNKLKSQKTTAKLRRIRLCDLDAYVKSRNPATNSRLVSTPMRGLRVV